MTHVKAGGSWLDRLKKMDMYTKTKDEARSQSGVGGAMAIVVVLVICGLFLSEMSEYLQPRTRDVLGVDIVRGDKITISFDFSFPAIKCAAVTIDLLDITGAHAQAHSRHIKKTRLDATGNSLQSHLDAGNNNNDDDGGKHGRQMDQPGYCHPCELELPNDEEEEGKKYVATYKRLKVDKTKHMPHCCNRCENLLSVYTALRLPPVDALRREPCKPKVQTSDDMPGEVGCRVGGYLRVHKVDGNLHVAAGRSTKQQHGSHSHHLHQVGFGSLRHFNVSHIIHKLHFGHDFHGKVEPLNGVTVIEPELAQYVYYVNVVPTVYRYSGGLERPAHQYSYTLHRQAVLLDSHHFPLPGFFVKYKFDALRMTKKAVNDGFAHFLTRTCALIGGTYVVLGLIYRIITGGVDMIKKNV